MAWSQDNLGVAGSNHAPLNTLYVNPSSIVDSKAFIDFNLVGVGAFAHNDFIYLPKESFSFMAFAGTPSRGVNYAYNTGKSRYKVVADVEVRGPSLMFNIKKSAIGFTTSVRSVTDVRGVSEEAVNFGLHGWNYEPQLNQQHSLRNLRVTSLNWAEFGITCGTILMQNQNNDLLTGGVSLKRLIGLAGGGLRIHDWTYEVSDSSLTSYNIDGAYGFNYADPEALGSWNKGQGWGIDVGFTYKKTLSDVESYVPFSPKENCTTCDYRYKFAAALIDIGRIRFDPPFIASTLDNDTPSEWEDFTTMSADNAEGLDAEIQNGLGNSGDGKSKHNMWLPGSITAQFDLNLGRNFYVNSTLIQGIPWKNMLAPQRGSQWSLAPRWETRNLEIAAPVTLHSWNDPSLGLMVRIRSIIIGTDKLGTYFFKSDVYGADIYFSLKYTIFKSFKCPKLTDPVGRPMKRKGKAVPCWG